LSSTKRHSFETAPHQIPFEQNARAESFIDPLLDEPEEAFGLADYWRVVRRHKWGILGIAFACILIGTLMALKSQPIYQAKTTILAEPVQPKMSNNTQYTSTALVWLFYETQYEIIKSRAIASRVVDQLGLVAREEARRAEIKEKGGADISLNWRAWIPEQWLSQIKELLNIPTVERKHSDEISAGERMREGVISSLVAVLSVKGGEKSEIIKIAYESSDASLSAEIVNAVAGAYVAFGLNSRLSSAKQTTSWLNNQISELREKLNESEAALEAYQKSTGMVDTESRQRLISAKLGGLSAEQVKTQTARSEAEIRYNQVLKIKKEGGGYESLVSVLNSPSVVRLREKHSEAKRLVSELEERYGERHPKMIAARADLIQASKVLDSTIEKVVGSIRKEYEVALAQERKINARMVKHKREISDVRGQGFALAKLEREVENNRQLYETFLGRFKEEDVAGEYDVSNVRIIDHAIVPNSPIRPNKPRIILISALVGLLLGIGFAVIRERLDNTFRTIEDLENRLALPVLGVMPLLKKLEKNEIPERYVSTAPRSPFTESINHVRTGVLFSNIDHPPKVILVTSATASEGKTTLSNNLAFAFSNLGRTLLIEADLRKPRFGGLFPAEGSLGLTDLISGKDNLQACMWQDAVNENLYVIGAGTLPPNPLEFLSSESFANTVQALRNKFDHIVIDAPPVLPVSDAIIIGRMVDGVMMAVKAETTTHQLARDALRRLQAAHIQPLGSVLTLADASRMAHYGSHYYHYDSGYYGYGEEERTARA